MKAVLCILATSLIIASAAQRSYGQEIVSFYPLFSERDAVLVPEIEGTWEFDFFGVDTISFERGGDNFYDAVVGSGGITSRFEAVFTELGGSLFLDLLPTKPTADCGESYQENSVPVHSLTMIAVFGDSIRLADMNYLWFYDNIIAKKSMESYLLTKSRVILTLPTDELRTFLNEHLHEGGFFGEETVARRIAGKPRQQIDVDRMRTGDDRQTGVTNDPLYLQLGCTPSFPYKNGWLGGDGGQAVPISQSMTVWLFGDTFVGRKDQKTRRGAGMVTTIGLSTCGADGMSDMQYYWRNMYSDHPDHFFQSHTDRYIFWALDGFMYDGDLFVIMQKTGPLPGSSPDAIFRFAVLGYTLAKVRGPTASSPSDWKIALFPWSQAVDAGQYQGGLAKDDKFVYLFMAKEGKQNFLMRLPLDKLESPDSNLEYFSRDETWKYGIDSSDAKVLFEDPLIGRANYIPEMKKWLVVYGPYFGENAIFFRTAPELVGPWSDRQVLYKCPELVKGTAQYDENNFCYCSRAVTTTIEGGSVKLLLTYTCNSSKQSKLAENMAIYSPQVVEVILPQ